MNTTCKFCDYFAQETLAHKKIGYGVCNEKPHISGSFSVETGTCSKWKQIKVHMVKTSKETG